MENPFLNHQYPGESLLEAINGLLQQIDKGYYGPTCRMGNEESTFLVSVREAAERENYVRKLIEEAKSAQQALSPDALYAQPPAEVHPPDNDDSFAPEAPAMQAEPEVEF